jgi:hypothetical protein
MAEELGGVIVKFGPGSIFLTAGRDWLQHHERAARDRVFWCHDETDSSPDSIDLTNPRSCARRRGMFPVTDPPLWPAQSAMEEDWRATSLFKDPTQSMAEHYPSRRNRI